MDARILDLIRDDARYMYEAYEFVCDAVTFTQERLGRGRAAEDDGDHHVSGGELLRGACDLAVREFGLMAPVVFRTWGLRRTDDFGAVVFKLIEAGRLSRSDRDDIEDFRDVFDLEKALTDGYAVDLGAPRRGER